MSVTEKQIEANRANSQHSTGPITEEGKAVSARNSLSHGLTAKDLFVPPGQEAEFQAFQEDLVRDLSPDSPVEVLLVNDIVSASWKLLRCDRSEAQLASRTSEPGLDPLLDPALASTLGTIERARTQAAKLLRQTLTELRRVQTERHYRMATMPEEEGYVTDCLGLSDWQIIRTRLKKERALDAVNLARDSRNEEAAAMAEIDAIITAPLPRVPYGPDSRVFGEIAKTNPSAATPETRDAAKNEKTNPIPAELRR